MVKIITYIFTFFLIAENGFAKDKHLPNGYMYINETPLCNIEKSKCYIPSGWKGLKCISKFDDLKLLLINIPKKKLIRPKINEYQIDLNSEDIKLTTNKILFNRLQNLNSKDKSFRYEYSINRQTLIMSHYLVTGTLKCNLVSPDKILKPLIDIIIKSKNENKL